MNIDICTYIHNVHTVVKVSSCRVKMDLSPSWTKDQWKSAHTSVPEHRSLVCVWAHVCAAQINRHHARIGSIVEIN